MGCFAGFCSSRFLKYGEQAHRIILWALVCWPWTRCSQCQTLQRFVYLSCDRHITEAFLVSEMFEGGDHVGLEVVPAEAELLVVGHGDFGWRVLCNRSHLRTIITLWTRNWRFPELTWIILQILLLQRLERTKWNTWIASQLCIWCLIPLDQGDIR